MKHHQSLFMSVMRNSNDSIARYKLEFTSDHRLVRNAKQKVTCESVVERGLSVSFFVLNGVIISHLRLKSYTGFLSSSERSIKYCSWLTKPYMAPECISDLVQLYAPTRVLRSSSQGMLCVRRSSSTKFYGDRTFCHAAATLWNNLPIHIHRSASREYFKIAIENAPVHPAFQPGCCVTMQCVFLPRYYVFFVFTILLPYFTSFRCAM